MMTSTPAHAQHATQISSIGDTSVSMHANVEIYLSNSQYKFMWHKLDA